MISVYGLLMSNLKNEVLPFQLVRPSEIFAVLVTFHRI
jgi:hypothetical protein